ncbi:hypothetical protein A28LD_0600 [Idiomarina sp. A28L]|uniref:hypothetical protein n=1 Tax=Idiomarina sp. A28L TaxID=1036674 RepID=UPI0002138E1D|nr:hypothetical protein [Idiomarina sp. A28L]EGN76112.1 hypothetical protein A28LD_0600 [Idiomarina sp. A28L]
MQPNTETGPRDKGLSKRQILFIYLCVSTLLLIGVYNRWQVGTYQTQQVAPTATANIAPSSTNTASETVQASTRLTDEEAAAQLQALTEEYEALLDERDRLARNTSPNDLEPMENVQRQLDWLNAIPKEEKTPELDSALLKFAMGVIPLQESFAIRPDDWQFIEEQEFFDAFYARLGYDESEFQEYFDNFTCTSSSCDASFTDLPEDVYAKMQSEFFLESNERLRNHPTLSISIRFSPSTRLIKLSVGRKK